MPSHTRITPVSSNAVLADNVILSNPWQNFSKQYDFEGMSDWVKGMKLPSAKVLIQRLWSAA